VGVGQSAAEEGSGRGRSQGSPSSGPVVPQGQPQGTPGRRVAKRTRTRKDGGILRAAEDLANLKAASPAKPHPPAPLKPHQSNQPANRKQSLKKGTVAGGPYSESLPLGVLSIAMGHISSPGAAAQVAQSQGMWPSVPMWPQGARVGAGAGARVGAPVAAAAATATA
ncbi:unnamed protein product, partial [Discosporangium mesarthrocarpum]